MAATRIKLNSGQMAALLKSGQVRAPLREIAQGVAAAARSGAPVDTGEYRNSIQVDSATTDRAVERVVAHDDKASAIESRTGNLKRALGR
jgi:hypothetical protein